mmetsp:Transcript_74667/g.198386  ORF Transcript_74667/g.198386 Transcript_74667/m.198386 type:complete len:323 (-) Transcript_74667:131-1099(-)
MEGLVLRPAVAEEPPDVNRVEGLDAHPADLPSGNNRRHVQEPPPYLRVFDVLRDVIGLCAHLGNCLGDVPQVEGPDLRHDFLGEGGEDHPVHRQQVGHVEEHRANQEEEPEVLLRAPDLHDPVEAPLPLKADVVQEIRQVLVSELVVDDPGQVLRGEAMVAEPLDLDTAARVPGHLQHLVAHVLSLRTRPQPRGDGVRAPRVVALLQQLLPLRRLLPLLPEDVALALLLVGPECVVPHVEERQPEARSLGLTPALETVRADPDVRAVVAMEHAEAGVPPRCGLAERRPRDLLDRGGVDGLLQGAGDGGPRSPALEPDLLCMP